MSFLLLLVVVFEPKASENTPHFSAIGSRDSERRTNWERLGSDRNPRSRRDQGFRILERGEIERKGGGVRIC